MRLPLGGHLAGLPPVQRAPLTSVEPTCSAPASPGLLPSSRARPLTNARPGSPAWAVTPSRQDPLTGPVEDRQGPDKESACRQQPMGGGRPAFLVPHSGPQEIIGTPTCGGGGEWDSEPGSQPPEAPGVGLRLGTQWASVSVYVAVCVGEGLVCLHSWNQGLTFHVSLLLSLLVPTPVLGPSSRASGPS